MNAQEKAREIFFGMYSEVSGMSLEYLKKNSERFENVLGGDMHRTTAKQCALIAAELLRGEILIPPVSRTRLKFWNDVKAEIERL